MDCIITTTGRINNLIETKKVDLSSIRFVFLEEADGMLDMGFKPKIQSIMSQVPDNSSNKHCSSWPHGPRRFRSLRLTFFLDPIQINVGEINVLNAIRISSRRS
jgi:ATP-dependent RNA helicase DDX5/DBP2